LRGGGDEEEQLAEQLSKLKSAEGKEALNVVMIGHVDAGKSTISGHLLYLTGMLDERTLEKFARESQAMGRSSWKFAWAMDLTSEEREKGKTHEVGQAYFETDARRYTLLDAPGHKTFVPNMIGGATQAEVAILVISARKGEFEAGFERGGQSREHAVLVRSGGARHVVVAINKMDECSWDQSRFDEIKTKLSVFLKSIGFNPASDLSFIPIEGLKGVNLKQPVDPTVCSWYQGPSLLQLLDSIPLPRRHLDKPVRIPISSAYRDGDVYALGKLESGRLSCGDELLLLPPAHMVKVTQILISDAEVEMAESGDMVRLKVSLPKSCGEEDTLLTKLTHPD
jgi:peptide chain release factor subunit 3